MRQATNTRSPGGSTSHRPDSESATPEPPDNTNATADNGGESQDIKASDLLLSSLSDGTDFTSEARPCNCAALNFEDREAARLTGVEQGMAEQLGHDVEDRARALLIEWSRESRSMATEYASRVGPSWAAFFGETE